MSVKLPENHSIVQSQVGLAICFLIMGPGIQSHSLGDGDVVENLAVNVLKGDAT